MNVIPIARMTSSAKTILITGGARGLAKDTCFRLAALGHHVVLTARDLAAGQRTVAEIQAKTPGARVEALALELSSLGRVAEFGQRFCAEGRTLDVLFNSAGVMQQSPERQLTPDGFEETLAVNALAPFVLTSTLMPALRRAPKARVVNVTSRLHLPDSRGAPVNFDFDDPQLERGYHPDRAYKNSKLAVLWFTYELQRRLSSSAITANAVCPGFVPVTAEKSTHGLQAWLMRNVLAHMPFARTVAEAADSFTFMAVDPSLDGVGGKFYGEKQPLASSPDSYDETKARRFWDFAEDATRRFMPAASNQ